MEPEKLDPIGPDPIPTTPPAVPAHLTLREDLEKYLQDADLFNEEEKKEFLDDMADTINQIVDVPIIGEKLERVAIRFLLGLGERVVSHFARKLIDKIA